MSSRRVSQTREPATGCSRAAAVLAMVSAPCVGERPAPAGVAETAAGAWFARALQRAMRVLPALETLLKMLLAIVYSPTR